MQIKHNVHTATNEQKEQVKRLWDCCFQDGAAFTDWFFNNVYKSDNTLVICEESRVVSALQIFYHDLSFCGEKIKAGYIAGVSTYPEYRNRGYASALMKEAFSVIYKNGADVAMLIPVNFNFYRKYGFACTAYLSDYTGDISLLAKYSGYRFSVAKKDTDLSLMYSKFTQNKNLFILRDENYFNEIREDTEISGGEIAAFEDGGYVIYTIVNEEFYALEIVYNSIDELYNIFSFIYAKRDEVKRFRIRTDTTGLIGKVLCESGVIEEKYPRHMMRILDAEKVAHFLKSDGGADIILKDSLIDRNNITLKLSENGSSVLLDIADFTKLVFGGAFCRFLYATQG